MIPWSSLSMLAVRSLARSLCLAGVLGAVCATTGCSSLALTSALPGFSMLNRDKDRPVIEIMALWQPGEGRDTKGLPCRGFAGQIFFFKQGSSAPTEIEGDVKIYVFDDQGTEEQNAKPMHVYEFKNGAWNNYLTKTNVGKAYQIFIPYPRKGDHRAVCSLRIKHEAPGGLGLLSDPADIILAGKHQKTSMARPVSVDRDPTPSSIPTQQTHIATLNRAGKYKSVRPGTDSFKPEEQVASGQRKNTIIEQFQQMPPGYQPPQEAAGATDEFAGRLDASPQANRLESASYREASSGTAEIELTGWSLHAEPLSGNSADPNCPTNGTCELKSQPRSLTPAAESRPISRTTPPVNSKPARHPLAAAERHPLDSGTDQNNSANPFEQTPTTPQNSTPTRNSSLKIRNISLE